MFILASKSPRRIELMQQLGLQFTVQLVGEIDEEYPPELLGKEIPLFLARLKANSFLKVVTIPDNTIVITADTIVWVDGFALGKPSCRQEAVEMLEKLSGKKHYVYSGVCLTTNDKQRAFFDETKVFFKNLSSEEINFYVDNYQPYDKAGAYGIQEWIGLVGIEKIEGSYFNVVGMPIQKLYSELCVFTKSFDLFNVFSFVNKK